jgi:hypothetical protein
MSLKPQPTGPVPDDTARVARAVFPKVNLCLTYVMRSESPTTILTLEYCSPKLVNPLLAPGA